MALEQLDINMQENESDPDLIHFTKINSHWTTELNVKHKNLKLQHRRKPR